MAAASTVVVAAVADRTPADHTPVGRMAAAGTAAATAVREAHLRPAVPSVSPTGVDVGRSVAVDSVDFLKEKKRERNKRIRRKKKKDDYQNKCWVLSTVH